MKVLKWLLKTILGLVITVAIIIGGVFLFVKIKYDINPFALISEVNILNKEVNENELFTNKFTQEDMASAKQVADAHMPGLITYDEESDTYNIGDSLSAPLALLDMNLTDKQCGAILNNLISQDASNAQVTIGDKTIDINLVQLSFVKLDVVAKTITINIVVKIDLSTIKADWKSFPMSYVAKKVPDAMFFSSTLDVKKLDNDFSYEVSSNDLTINNLNSEQTKDFVKALNAFSKVGTSEELNVKIGQAFVDGLIGYDDNHKGFAYALKTLGVKDYNFELKDEIIYFVLIPKI